MRIIIKNKLIFLVTLFITCLWLWRYEPNHCLSGLSIGLLYGQVPFDSGIAKKLSGELAATPTQESGETEEIIVRPNIVYKSERLRDPFQSYLEKKESPVVTPQIPEPEPIEVPLPDLELQGLFWGGKFPQAIINNKVVKETDMIGQVKIISINKDGVTVLFTNREYKLSAPGLSKPKSSQKSKTQKPQTQEPQTQEPQTQKPQTQKPQTQKPQTQNTQKGGK